MAFHRGRFAIGTTLLLLSLVLAWPGSGKSAGVVKKGCPFVPVRAASERAGRITGGPARLERKLAASSTDCGLTVAGKAHEFSSCETLTTGGSFGYTVHSAILPASTTTSTLQVGVQATGLGSSGWAGFGIPTTPGFMLGSRAAIAATWGSGETSLAGYPLESRIPSQINAAKGQVAIGDPVVELASDGSLRAVFSMAVDGSVDSLTASPFNIIFAMGPVSPSGEIEAHNTGGFPFGGATLQLAPLSGSGTGTAASPSTTPALAPGVEGQASLAPEPSAEAPAGPEGALEAPGPAPGPEAVDSESAAPLTIASVDSPSTSAPAPSSSPSCTLDTGDGEETFANCAAIDSDGTTLFWEPVNAATGSVESGSGSARMGYVHVGSSDGWAAVGFPSVPGVMIGADAVVIKRCSTCTSGASLATYSLDDETTSGVVESSFSWISNASALARSDGALVGTWLMTGQVAGRRRLLEAVGQAGMRDWTGGSWAGSTLGRSLTQTPSSVGSVNGNSMASMPLIFAWGDTDGSGGLLEHRTTATLSAQNLTEASITASPPVAATVSNPLSSTKVKVHAAMTTVGWGILLPLGILSVRSRLRVQPTAAGGAAGPPNLLWLWLHQGLQVVGGVVGIAGTAVGYTLGDLTTGSTTEAHKGIGSVVLALVILQCLLGTFRPKPGPSKRRLVWRLLHEWLGRIGIALAIANIFIGFVRIGDLGVWPYATYAGFLGVLVVLFALNEVDAARARARALCAADPASGSSRPSSGIAPSSSETSTAKAGIELSSNSAFQA